MIAGAKVAKNNQIVEKMKRKLRKYDISFTLCAL